MGSSVILPQPGQPKEGADKDFQQKSQPQLVRFQFTNVAPPGPLYLSQDDSLQLQPTSSVAATLRLSLRFLRNDGIIVPSTQDFKSAGVRSSETFDLFLGEGFILGLQVGAVGSPVPLIGQTWVNLNIRRGAKGIGPSIACIAFGYVTSQAQLIWPGNANVYAPQGPGVIRSITGTVPAAGAEITETVPTNTRWRLQQIIFTLTTSAAAGNRQVHAQLWDGVNRTYSSTFVVNQIAATTQTYSCVAGITPQTDAANFNTLSISGPPMLGTGHQFRTGTGGLLAGDQYSAPQYVVEEWIDV